MLVFMDNHTAENEEIFKEICSHCSEEVKTFNEAKEMLAYLQQTHEKPEIGLFFFQELEQAKNLIHKIHAILDQEQLLMYYIAVLEPELKERTDEISELIETIYIKPVEVLEILKEVKKSRNLIEDFNLALPGKLLPNEKTFKEESLEDKFIYQFNDQVFGLKDELAAIKDNSSDVDLPQFFMKWKTNLVWPGKSVVTKLTRKEVMFLEKDFEFREVTEHEFEIRAKNLGLIQLRYSQLEFFSLLGISKDFMQAYVLIFPILDLEAKLAYKYYYEMLSDSHVTYGIRSAEFEKEYQKCLEQKVINYFLIAQGDQPEEGHPEYAQLLIQKEEIAGKIKDDQGTIDYREHNKLINVKKGDVIAQYTSAKEAKDGIRVNGDAIKALMSNPGGILMGENIVLDEEKSVYVADIDGMLVFEKKAVHLRETLVIKGNVNLKTGNIHSAKNIIIQGDVEADMVVEAKGNIVIKGTVEDGRVVAGGDIEAHGFTGSGKTWVFANGHISCDFTQQSHLEARGNISFRKFCVNAQLFAGDKIIGADKSKLIGGEIHAGNGIEVFELGNLQETPAKIFIGSDHSQEKILSKISNRIQSLQEEKKQILNILKSLVNIQQPLKPQLAKLPKIQVDRFIEEMKLLKNKQELEKKLTLYLEEQKQTKQNNKNARLIIHSQIFPGNELQIDAAHKKLKEKFAHGVFFFHTAQNEIIFAAQ